MAKSGFFGFCNSQIGRIVAEDTAIFIFAIIFRSNFIFEHYKTLAFYERKVRTFTNQED